MFKSQDVIEALVVGIVFGIAVGVVATSLLIVDPLLRERDLFRDRIIQERLRTYAAQARGASHRMMSEREKEENDQHSLRVVQ